MAQTGTHQYTMYHNIQTLLDMSQRSSSPHILILHLIICDKRSTIHSDRFPYSSNLLI